MCQRGVFFLVTVFGLLGRFFLSDAWFESDSAFIRSATLKLSPFCTSDKSLRCCVRLFVISSNIFIHFSQLHAPLQHFRLIFINIISFWVCTYAHFIHSIASLKCTVSVYTKNGLTRSFIDIIKFVVCICDVFIISCLFICSYKTRWPVSILTRSFINISEII